MGQYNVYIAGIKMEHVFNLYDKNYIGFREMTETLEGLFIGGKPSVEWDEASETSLFRVYDRLAGVVKEIKFSIKNLAADVLTPRQVTINGKTEYIGFVFHADRNMIGVRDFAKLAGLEGYLQWYEIGDAQFVDLRKEDPYLGFGGLKEMAKAVVNSLGGKIPAALNYDFYQLIYDTAYLGPKFNRYSGYVFTEIDAVQWLLQTGGKASFVLQVRDTEKAANQIEAAVEGQWKIIQCFLQAQARLALCGFTVKLPRFFVGTPEENVNPDSYGAKGIIAIFEGIMGKLRGAGMADASIRKALKGIYFGSETAKTCIDIAVVQNYIKAYGGELLWVPYFINEKDKTKIVEFAAYFDKVILQPSTFYYDVYAYKDENGAPFRNAAGEVISKQKKWGDIFSLIKSDPAKFGVELEFDIGLVTGRSDVSPDMAPAAKQGAFVEYIEWLFGGAGTGGAGSGGAAGSGGVGSGVDISGIPIGIYSGGPNEQGYNNVFMNGNLHNNQNHTPTIDGFGTGSKYNGAYRGNLIYKISGALFSDKSAGSIKAEILKIMRDL